MVPGFGGDEVLLKAPFVVVHPEGLEVEVQSGVCSSLGAQFDGLFGVFVDGSRVVLM